MNARGWVVLVNGVCVNDSYIYNFNGELMEDFTSKALIFLDEHTDGDRLTLTITMYASKPI